MSNIGKLLISLPPKLKISIFDSNQNFYLVAFTGPLGTINITLPNEYIIHLNHTNSTLSLSLSNTSLTKKSPFSNSMYGTVRNLLFEAITGVTSGYSKTLELVGIGYKANYIHPILSLSLGKSHLDQFIVPEGIQISNPNPSTIIGFSFSKSLLSSFFNKVLLSKPASKDHYKGKGLLLK